MSEAEVWERRLLHQVGAQGLRAVQERTTRRLLVLSATNEVLAAANAAVVNEIAATRRFLRGYGMCGVHRRQCFVNGRYVCTVH